MNISVRIDYLFRNETPEEQLRIAKEAGADAVETGQMLDCDCASMAKAAEKYEIPFVACGFYDMWNCRMGAPYSLIEENLRKTVDCAKILGCRYLLGLGIDCDARNETQTERFVENMKPVAELLEKHGMVVLLEPHNTRLKNPEFDFSSYFISTCSICGQLIRRIGSSSVQMLFDVFHEQVMTGNLTNTILDTFPITAHYHLSGVPARDEPMHGEVEYRNLVREILDLNYRGYFGLEYYPTGSAAESLRKSVAFLRTS